MGWDGMEWNKMGWDGIGFDGMGEFYYQGDYFVIFFFSPILCLLFFTLYFTLSFLHSLPCLFFLFF